MPEIYLSDLEQNINFDSKKLEHEIKFYDDNLNFAGWFVKNCSGWFKVYI